MHTLTDMVWRRVSFGRREKGLEFHALKKGGELRMVTSLKCNSRLQTREPGGRVPTHSTVPSKPCLFALDWNNRARAAETAAETLKRASPRRRNELGRGGRSSFPSAFYLCFYERAAGDGPAFAGPAGPVDVGCAGCGVREGGPRKSA